MQYKWLILYIMFLVTSLYSDEIIFPKHIIHIKGNQHIDLEAIEDVLDVERHSIFAFWKEDIPHIKDKLLPTLENTLESFYISEGFYDAKFKIKETNTKLDIKISENKPIKITQVENTSDYPIDAFLALHKGDIFKSTTFIAIKNRIIQALLEEGYCSYQLDTKAYVDLVKHSAELTYKLKKGGLCTFGKANITGIKSIDEDVILSRVRAKEGERFDPKKVQETYSGIYALNSFDTVQVSVDRKIYNVVPIDIALHEVENAYHFEGGVGYDTYIGPRIHASLVKKNFFGNAQETGIRFSWSKREQLIIGDYYKPALFPLFGYWIDFGIQLGYSNLEYRGFKEKKTFAKVYLEHNEGRLKLRTGLALENIDIELLDNLRKSEALRQAIKEGNFLLFYPYADIVYDARDDKLNPKYGYYLAASLEYGLPYKEDASTYTKTLLEGRLIHTFDRLTLASVLKVGIVDMHSQDLPESKFFFAGGSFSNRAYGFNTIGVINSPTSDSIAGASSLLNLSLEADYPIWDKLYGAVFTDNTMLNEKSYDFSGDIITSAGVGIRYLTPIGPFKVDVGFNVHDLSQYGISFQIGQSF